VESLNLDSPRSYNSVSQAVLDDEVKPRVAVRPDSLCTIRSESLDSNDSASTLNMSSAAVKRASVLSGSSCGSLDELADLSKIQSSSLLHRPGRHDLALPALTEDSSSDPAPDQSASGLGYNPFTDPNVSDSSLPLSPSIVSIFGNTTVTATTPFVNHSLSTVLERSTDMPLEDSTSTIAQISALKEFANSTSTPQANAQPADVPGFVWSPSNSRPHSPTSSDSNSQSPLPEPPPATVASIAVDDDKGSVLNLSNSTPATERMTGPMLSLELQSAAWPMPEFLKTAPPAPILGISYLS
jgi:hypothetical protein